MTSRLVLLRTSPRVPPGLLSSRAWEELRAGVVCVGSPGHPQLPYVEDAGVDYEVLSGPPAAVAAELVERAHAGPVVWLAAEGEEALLRAVAERVTRDPSGVEVEVLHGSYDLPGARLLDLVATMDTLRRDCPWDARQTHQSLAKYLIEESYETVEAIETNDLAALREELGDVLLQVVFHARVAEERRDDTRFTIDDVAAGIVEKLRRRHPHVFGDVTVAGAEEVTANWEAIKAAEREEKDVADASLLAGVPFGQPALALAHALQRRAARAGVPEDLIARAVPGLGGQLFALVARAREVDADAEAALRAAAREFAERVRVVERAARAAGRDPRELSQEEWRRLWPPLNP